MVEYMMKALKMSLNTVRMRAKRLLKDCVIEKCDKIVECKCKKFSIKRASDILSWYMVRWYITKIKTYIYGTDSTIK